MPLEAYYLWQHFLQLHGSRTGTGYGPNPLSHQEIEAYARLIGWEISAEEFKILRTIDQAYMLQHAESISKDPPKVSPSRREE